MPPKWLERTGGRWGRTRCRTCHGTSFPLSSLPIVSGTYDRRLAQFAILEKNYDRVLDYLAERVFCPDFQEAYAAYLATPAVWGRVPEACG